MCSTPLPCLVVVVVVWWRLVGRAVWCCGWECVADHLCEGMVLGWHAHPAGGRNPLEGAD